MMVEDEIEEKKQRGMDDYERDKTVSDPQKTAWDFLSNFRGARNTRINSSAELKMMSRWELLAMKGIAIAGKFAQRYYSLKWSVDNGLARTEAVDALRTVSKSGVIQTGLQPIEETK